MILLAYKIAFDAHKGQKDRGGKDYILHPLYVAKLVQSEEEKIVALLHDVIEDTDITLDDLRASGFPESVINALDAITKRPGETYSDYLERVVENPIALSVKIADITHNADLSRIPNPTEKDIARTAKYNEALKYLKARLSK